CSRRREEGAEGSAGAIEVLYARTVSEIHVREYSTKAGDRSGRETVRARNKKRHVRNVAADFAQQTERAERSEDCAICRVTELRRQIGRLSLYGARSRCRYKRAPDVQECGKHRRSGNSGSCCATAVPVDLAATRAEWARIISVVGITQYISKSVYSGLDRAG